MAQICFSPGTGVRAITPDPENRYFLILAVTIYYGMEKLLTQFSACVVYYFF